jgi:ATP-dependent Clp protease ATP-binding subunit ClpC
VAPGRGASKTLERFGDSARRAVELAQHEATELDHQYLGTEHLLLGLIAEGEGVAAQALEALGLTAGGTRARIEGIIGRGECSCPGPVPFTPRSTKVLRLAVEEAEAMGDQEVDTEHVLLALVREGEGVAAQILIGEGVDEQRTRLQVSALLGRPCAPGGKSRGGRRSFRRSR